MLEVFVGDDHERRRKADSQNNEEIPNIDPSKVFVTSRLQCHPTQGYFEALATLTSSILQICTPDKPHLTSCIVRFTTYTLQTIERA